MISSDSFSVSAAPRVTAAPHSARGSETPSKSKGLKPHRIIRCSRCRKYICEVVIEVIRPVVGPLVTLNNLRCVSCGWNSNVDIEVCNQNEIAVVIAEKLKDGNANVNGKTA